MILPNRDELKLLSDLNIDSQIVQQLGTQIFNPRGDDTNFQEACSLLSTTLDSIVTEATSLKSKITTSS